MFATTPKQIIASTNIGWLYNSLTHLPIIWVKNDRKGNIELSLRVNHSQLKSDKYIILSDLSKNPHQGLFEIGLICQMIRCSKPQAKIELLIPYLPYSRHDKIIPGKPVALQFIAKFLQSLNIYKIYSLDIHNEDFTAQLIPNLVNWDSAQYISKYIKQSRISNYVIISPDKGRSKQAEKISSMLSCPTITLQKTRKNNITHQISSIDTKKVKERNLIIIEDIIDTGQSLNSALKLLNQLSPANIYIISSFMLNKHIKYANHSSIIGPDELVDKTLISEIITDILKQI